MCENVCVRVCVARSTVHGVSRTFCRTFGQIEKLCPKDQLYFFLRKWRRHLARALRVDQARVSGVGASFCVTVRHSAQDCRPDMRQVTEGANGVVNLFIDVFVRM